METFWETELWVYGLVLPELEKIQKNSKTKLLWPHCYGLDRDGSDKVLLLEDLSVKGYQICRLDKSLDLVHATLVLEQLACLHAASFVLQCVHRDRFESLLRECENIERRYDFVDYLDPSIKFANEHVDCDEFQNILKKFCSFDFKEKVRYLRNGHNYMYSVITHGDVWVNNLLFQYDEDTPTGVILLDYQISRYSSPLCDLYFMLFLAVDEATRDGHFMDLVNTYERALRQQIVELGQDPEQIYPKEQFQRDLRTFSYSGMAQTLHMLPMFANNPKDVQEHLLKIRAKPMVKGKPFVGVPIASPEYMNRVKQMTRDIIKHGLADLW
ncbi:hypothetical protein EVAR_103626_1 [Eumeta japonica]|uniref:CHK kinase-like domain-containing protein n=1 Tax=Eumeta variegata TaxID=151549 RepID=A0A4C1ZGZ9_EUMVA|nr:hypothetical protein EVAR_103626_1 [Eumeta japonica]